MAIKQLFESEAKTISEHTGAIVYSGNFEGALSTIVSNKNSILYKGSDIKILLPKVKEADITGMVPTSSTSITLLLGDCLATTAMQIKKFSKEKFKIYHPGGNIGKSLLLAKDIMVTGSKMPVVNFKTNFNKVLQIMNQKNLGMIVVTKNKFIMGLITDGDLRRELNKKSSNKNILKILTKSPLTVNENMPASKALGIMSEKKVTSLLVISDKDVSKKNKVLKGIIHIHSILQTGVQ